MTRRRGRLLAGGGVDYSQPADDNPPAPRRSTNMPDTTILRSALYILGAALLLCLGGIIWLSSANPARAIPDVLVATTGLVSGGLVGILVPTKGRGEGGETVVGYAIAALVVVVLIVVLLRLL